MPHSAETTPIIPGFYPDPSVCRVGDTFYLVNSSFEYFPGVPVFESDDLVHWAQIGNAFDRESQLPPSDGTASSGIFAPTLRYHDDQFWLITTILGSGVPEQVILRSASAHGPWSEPVTTTGAVGIDPDLAWDGDDCYLTWTSFAGPIPGINQARIDPTTAQLLESPRSLWSGTGLAAPEGPHLYQRGGWWYLLIAEGGTERGHCVSVARSRRPDGPFEGAPANPIFSHRSTMHPVQNTGHADLVETGDGSWAMVYLGVRPRGSSPGFHVNGRETFLASVDWVDDWPVVAPYRGETEAFDTAFVDEFAGDTLEPRWISPGVPAAHFTTPVASGGVLVRPLGGGLGLLAVRCRDDQWTAVVVVDTTAGTGRVVVRIDVQHWCGLEVDDDEIRAVQTVGGITTVLASRAATGATTRVFVRAVDGDSGNPFSRTGPDVLEFGIDGEPALASIDGRYLSTEVAGGFTGRVIGVQATAGSFGLLRFGYGPL